MNAAVAGLLSLVGVVVGYAIAGTYRRHVDAKAWKALGYVPHRIHNTAAPTTAEIGPTPCPQCGNETWLGRADDNKPLRYQCTRCHWLRYPDAYTGQLHDAPPSEQSPWTTGAR